MPPPPGSAAGRTGSATPVQLSDTPAAAAAPEASSGQRGWNRQPAGILVASGGSPVSTTGGTGTALRRNGSAL